MGRRLIRGRQDKETIYTHTMSDIFKNIKKNMRDFEVSTTRTPDGTKTTTVKGDGSDIAAFFKGIIDLIGAFKK